LGQVTLLCGETYSVPGQEFILLIQECLLSALATALS